MIETQTGISIIAALISLSVFILSIRSYRENFRPVVIAEIKTHSGGNHGMTFSLFIRNVGSRPACDIRLLADQSDIKAILNPGADSVLVNDIYKCFSNMATVALLAANEYVENSFGSTSVHSEHNVLVYGASLPIKIEYRDLNGRKFRSYITLIIKDSLGFAGGFWGERKE